jgi:hypothetical protein
MRGRWKLISLGDRKYRLETRAGRIQGWIRGHAVGFLGLRDKAAALACAPTLRRALDAVLVREYPDRYQPVRDFHDLLLVHDGAYEWIAARDVPIARLDRPGSKEFDGDTAIEFVLPSYASEQVTIAAAAVLAHTLHARDQCPSLTGEDRRPTSRGVSARPRGMNRTRDVAV